MLIGPDLKIEFSTNSKLVLEQTPRLKTKAFIVGMTKNPEARIFFIHFIIDTPVANISLYALSCSKLNSGYYITFKIIFSTSKPAFSMQIQESTDSAIPFPSDFCYCFYF